MKLLKSFKTFPVNWTDQWISKRHFIPRKSCLLYSMQDLIETFHALHDKAALLTIRGSERGTGDRHQRFIRKVWITYVQKLIRRWVFDGSDEIEIRLPFYDLSQHFGIYLAVFSLKLFIHG